MTEVVLFNVAEAEKFSTEIRKRMARASQDIDGIRRMIAEAEEREAWRALGFRSMAAYARMRLGMSRANAYRVLDQVHALLLSGPAQSAAPTAPHEAAKLGPGPQKSVPRGTESDHLPRPQAAASQRDAARRMGPLKQKTARRGIPDKTGAINAISNALDAFEAKADGHEDEEVVAYLSHEERRALERAASKAGAFAERWGDLLTRPIERRYIEDSA